MHEGHRQRLTKRFLSEGLESFEEHEILEFMLFYVIPRQDTNATAHRLLEKFGSLAGVLEANAADIATVAGMGDRAAAYLTMFPGVLRAYKKSKIGERPIIQSIQKACDFAISLLYGKPYEQFYVIWLNTQNRVIHYEKLSEGGISSSPIYMNKVAAAGLRHHAVKGIIAHNHPGGDVTPSPMDVQTTHEIMHALGVLDIELVDHIIVSDDACFSFQADSLMGKRNIGCTEAFAAEYAGVRQLVSVLTEKGCPRLGE